MQQPGIAPTFEDVLVADQAREIVQLEERVADLENERDVDHDLLSVLLEHAHFLSEQLARAYAAERQRQMDRAEDWRASIAYGQLRVRSEWTSKCAEEQKQRERAAA